MLEGGDSPALSLLVGSSEGRAAFADRGVEMKIRQHNQRHAGPEIKVCGSFNVAIPLAQKLSGRMSWSGVNGVFDKSVKS